MTIQELQAIYAEYGMRQSEVDCMLHLNYLTSDAPSDAVLLERAHATAYRLAFADSCAY